MKKNIKYVIMIILSLILLLFQPYFLTISIKANVHLENSENSKEFEWSDEIKIINRTNPINYPKIVADSDNNIHCVWVENDKKNEIVEAFYIKFNKDGEILINPTKINTNVQDFSITVDSNDNLYLVWKEYFGHGNSEIYFRKQDKNGNILVNNTRVTHTDKSSSWSKLALDSQNNVHIVWQDLRDKTWEVYYTKLDNNGNTIIDDKRLSTNDTFRSEQPDIGIDTEDNVHIIWEDKRNKDVNNPPLSDDFENSEIYYSKLNDEGNILVNNKRLTYSKFQSNWPEIGIDSDDNINIVWWDNRNSKKNSYDENHEIYYKKINNKGEIVVNDTRLTYAEGTSGWPSIAIDQNDHICITWKDYRGEEDVDKGIYYMELDKNGFNTTDEIKIHSSGHYMVCTCDLDNRVYIIWEDNEYISSGEEYNYLYYRYRVYSLNNENNNDDEYPTVVYILIIIILILVSLIFTIHYWYPTKK